MHTTTLDTLFADYAQTKAARGMADTRRCLYLPYCLQLGDKYGHANRCIVLNRYYQPLLVNGDAIPLVDYSLYPDGYWLPPGKPKNPTVDWDNNGLYWFYDDANIPEKAGKAAFSRYSQIVYAVLGPVWNAPIYVGDLKS